MQTTCDVQIGEPVIYIRAGCTRRGNQPPHLTEAVLVSRENPHPPLPATASREPQSPTSAASHPPGLKTKAERCLARGVQEQSPNKKTFWVSKVRPGSHEHKILKRLEFSMGSPLIPYPLVTPSWLEPTGASKRGSNGGFSQNTAFSACAFRCLHE
jgi:hypothetical protein